MLQFPLSSRENSVWIRTIQESPLSWLSSTVWQNRDSLSLFPPTLYCTVYWSLETVPWLPAKYVYYYGNQSKQGNWRKNRRHLKIWLIWIYGSETEFVEVWWEISGLRRVARSCDLGLIPCHMSFLSNYLLENLNKHSYKTKITAETFFNREKILTD